MKPKEAASNLKIKLPSHDQKSSPAVSTGSKASGKKSHDTAPKLSDIAPLNWKKRTTTTPLKPRSAEIPQGSRSELKKKSSAPDLRRRKIHFDGAANLNSPRQASHVSNLRKKFSAPDLRRSKGEHVPGIGDCPPLPRHMISSPSLRVQSKNKDADQGPRFMPVARDEENPSRFNKRPHIGAPKLPSIIGSAPSRRPKKKKPQRAKETRAKRAMRIMKHPGFRRKWKVAVRQLANMKMRKRIHGCARLIRSSAQRRAIDIERGPIYNLREMKRASAMLALPKIQRLPSIGDLVHGHTNKRESHDKDKDSDGSVYSERPEGPGESPTIPALTHHPARRPGTAAVNRRDNRRIRHSLLPYRDWIDILEQCANPFFNEDSERAASPLEPPLDPAVNFSEDHSVRASLIPFRDLLLRFESNRNSLALENSRDPQISLPSTTFSTNSTLEIRSDINPSSLPPRPLPTLPGPALSLPGDKSSNTLQPPPSTSSIAFSDSTGVMATSPPSDPFVDPSAGGEDLTQTESQAFDLQEPRHDRSDRPAILSPGENTPTAYTPRSTFPQKDYDTSDPQPARPRMDGGLSRIPRVPTQRRHHGLTSSGQKGLATPEHHSSIPVSVRKNGPGKSDPHETPDQRFSGGIRMLEKPGGSRHPAAEKTEHEPESGLPVEGPDSSSISSFGCDGPDEIVSQRPTGLTGENRVRPRTRAELLERYGPQLKIDSSADRILLGRDNDTSDRQGSTSSSPLDHGRSIIPAPRYEYINVPHSASGHSQFSRDMSGPRLDENTPPGADRDVPNFSRSQIPSDNYSRKSDFSGKELDIHRKPASESNLRMQRESYGSENIPPVPRVPTMRKNGTKKSVYSNEPTTPLGTPEYDAEMSSRVDPFTLSGPLDSHPPRNSSLQAQAGSDFTSHGSRDETKDAGLTHKPSNINIDDIVEQHEQEKQDATESGARLPDSKSNRMLDNFRSIFSKSRTGERSSAGKEQIPSNSKRGRNTVESPDSGKPTHQTSKSRPKWSKSTRSLKSDDISSPSPIMPLPAPSLLPSPSSYSSFPPPPSARRQESHTPSFARPTRSTRTRTAASSKQTSVSQEARMHRIKVLTPSTGSPSRTARIQKRSANLTGNSTPNPRDTRSESDYERPHPPEKDPPVGAKLADSGRIGVGSVQESIEVLCEKICSTDSMPMKRAKYLRLALSLQQQLSDYKSVEKEARDLESLLSQKKGDKGLALNSLIQYLDQVRLQIDEV